MRKWKQAIFLQTESEKKEEDEKKITETQPEILDSLDKLVSPLTRGDPESPLRWTCKSTYKLEEELKKQGYEISANTVGTLLKNLGYSLQAPSKSEEGGNHKDRDAQFQYINEKVSTFHQNNQPVLSVDAKKKENIGNYANKGKEYQPKGKPERVKVYDFPDKKKGKVTPYGIYDEQRDEGFVNVGISSDTAEFAVNSIRKWWYKKGQATYNNSPSILITADGGGSNGSRVRLWKTELQKLANELEKEIHVCHFPPGTSKWNKIEHKMFCHISSNWRGKPLISREVVVNLIGNTTTKTGLRIDAELDENIYEKGIKISDEQFAKVNLHKDDFHGNWNYIIKPSLNT